MLKSVESRLLLSLIIATSIALLEVSGGILSNSLALLGDAGHVGSDALAIGLTLMAARMARRPHTPSLTFGYHRGDILAAFINGTLLLIIAFYLFREAYSRLISPPSIEEEILLVVASIGLVANLIMILLLKKGSRSSLGVKGAFFHVVSDTLNSVGVILGGIAIMLTGLPIIDAIIALLIGAIILRGSISLLRDTARILMEGTPRHIRLEEIYREIRSVEGVKGVHDLHVWAITSNLNVLSGHVLLEDQTISNASTIIKKIGDRVKDRFGIQHVTLQVECEVPISLKVGSQDRDSS